MIISASRPPKTRHGRMHCYCSGEPLRCNHVTEVAKRSWGEGTRLNHTLLGASLEVVGLTPPHSLVLVAYVCCCMYCVGHGLTLPHETLT